MADAAARRLQVRTPAHRHRVRDGPPRGRPGPAGLRRLDTLHRPGRRDPARRDAVRGDAAAGVQPCLPQGPGTARRAGGPARLASAVRPALDDLLGTLVRETRGRGARLEPGVGIPALQHDGAGRRRGDGRGPRTLADDRARARGRHAGERVRHARDGAGAVPAGHGAGRGRQARGAGVSGMDPDSGNEGRRRSRRATTRRRRTRAPATGRRWSSSSARRSQRSTRTRRL